MNPGEARIDRRLRGFELQAMSAEGRSRERPNDFQATRIEVVAAVDHTGRDQFRRDFSEESAP